MFYDLFEQILSGGFLDSSEGIGIGISECEIEVATDTNITVMVVPCLILESSEEIKKALTG